MIHRSVILPAPLRTHTLPLLSKFLLPLYKFQFDVRWHDPTLHA